MTSQSNVELHFAQTYVLDDTYALQADDGTIFYLTCRGRNRIYVRFRGSEIDVAMPREKYDFAFVHGIALYIAVGVEIYKVVFNPPDTISVSLFRKFLKDERLRPDGFCYGGQQQNTRLLRRMCDASAKDGILIDVPEKDLQKAMLIAAHRGKAIYLRTGEHPVGRKLSNNVILIELPFAIRTISAQDSSPYLYIGEGQMLRVFNTNTMEFLPSLQADRIFQSIIGVYEGMITIRQITSGILYGNSLHAARLPNGYFQTKIAIETPLTGYSSKFTTEFTVKSILGEGAFGCVFKASNNVDRAEYAVKRIAVDKKKLEKSLGEVRKMALLDHQNIIRYNSSWIERPPEGWQPDADSEMLKKMALPRNHLKMSMNYADDSVFIFIQMQLCIKSLSDWLKDNDQESSRNLRRMTKWFKQMIAGVEYIHRSNIIHRDLKPSNVLFVDNDVIKLCDLGIATERLTDDKTDTVFTRTDIGTKLYMSPEQSSSFLPYSSKTDVFALGLILAELCVLMTAEERTEIFDNYRRGVQCDRISDANTGKFIEMLTQVEPDNRPTCREMLDHLFLA